MLSMKSAAAAAPDKGTQAPTQRIPAQLPGVTLTLTHEQLVDVLNSLAHRTAFLAARASELEAQGHHQSATRCREVEQRHRWAFAMIDATGRIAREAAQGVTRG